MADMQRAYKTSSCGAAASVPAAGVRFFMCQQFIGACMRDAAYKRTSDSEGAGVSII